MIKRVYKCDFEDKKKVRGTNDEVNALHREEQRMFKIGTLYLVLSSSFLLYSFIRFFKIPLAASVITVPGPNTNETPD